MRLTASKKSIDLIIMAEIISEGYYTRSLQHPIWPKGKSGVTIGIGYDLGMNTTNQIKMDLAGIFTPEEITVLTRAAGLSGEAALHILQTDRELRLITMPLDKAKALFYKKSLPRYAAMTRRIYPGLENLKPDAVGALVSMVYNRGDALAGPARLEMKNIIPLVKRLDYEGIAKQIEASKRIWVGKNLPGLLVRRDAEANSVRKSVRDYKPDELIDIEI